MEASNSEGTVTGVPSNRESDAARLAQALALETQVRGVDGQIREQLTMATSGTRTASLDSRVCCLHPNVISKHVPPAYSTHQAGRHKCVVIWRFC